MHYAVSYFTFINTVFLIQTLCPLLLNTVTVTNCSNSMLQVFFLHCKDLVNSGQGETVTNILIDLNGFWTYENREVLVTDPNNDDDL